MMHLAGFPVNGKIDKPCDPQYCGNGNFKEELREIKQRFSNF